ncbi:FAD-dependent oxidoreductase [Geobacter sp. FeAm09]|uniref:FAD-dependent oxidoreductase n=1 Tax=Geobacter sp. FeAm09 TaxID=2597769 RepID=UPI00143DDC68|nr:FAD-dependent oxidoreductase [Geobacter sp. FeAm09]
MKRCSSRLSLVCFSLVVLFSGIGNAADKSISTDVVVVGAGSAGLSAAVSAAYAGAKVIVLEKMPFAGGSSNFAEGLFAVKTDQQRRKAIGLTKEEAYWHAMDYHHYRNNAGLLAQTVANSTSIIEWLEKQGVGFEVVTMSPTEAPTWHLIKDWGTAHHGAALVQAMQAKAKELGVKIYFETPAKELIYNGGAVAGVKAVNAKGDHYTINAKAVVIATGGFNNSKEMVRKWTRFDADKVFPTVPINKTGDGINMALAAGADSEGWGLMLHPGTHGEGIKPLGPLYAMTWQPLLWVNKYGDRVVDENAVWAFTFAGNAIERQRDGFVWSIWDDETVRYMEEHGIDNGLGVLVPIGTKLTDLRAEIATAVAQKSSSIVVGDSIEELAQKMGVEPARLKENVDQYNHAKETGRDEKFYRKADTIVPVKTGKLYALKVFPYNFVSIGGVKTDLKMEVTDKNDKAIPGLYAAGADVGGLYGDTYATWTSGMMFQWAAQSGKIAGEQAAAYGKR